MGSELLTLKPIINIGASIRELRRKLRLVLGILDALTDKLAEIERELAVMEGSRNVGSGGPPPSGDNQIAYNLDIRTHANGSIEVAIDGGVKFSLGPRLAEVFRFLASADKERGGNDELVGWRSREEINKFLNDSTDKQLRASYANHMAYLLKKALRKAGYECNLIQSHRQKGYRLALKHSSSVRLKEFSTTWQ
jgi:hypothetical protein